MTNLKRDVGIFASLVLALGVVGVVDQFLVKPDDPADVRNSGESTTPSSPRFRLAVSSPVQFDDMGRLLGELGEGFSYDSLDLDALSDQAKILDYEVIFLTCGVYPRHWATSVGAASDRPGVVEAVIDPGKLRRLGDSLRAYVDNGGTLYVSDLRLHVLFDAFPDVFDRGACDRAQKQTVKAKVVDPGLRDEIGETLSLDFNQDGWLVPGQITVGGESRSTVFLEGEYTSAAGGQRTNPLLVKAPHGKGAVIFTSFHNERVNGAQETKLLRYLVFTALTAKEVGAAEQNLLDSGFSQKRTSILDVSREQAVTRTYQNKKAGKLRFILSFKEGGATLRLDVDGPGNRHYHDEGSKTLVIEVPDAPVGDWTCTVKAVSVDTPKFHFGLTVGQ